MGISTPKLTVPSSVSIFSRLNQSWVLQPGLLLGLIGLMGTAFALIVPPFQVCDEDGHFIRAYEISRGHVIGRSAPTLPPALIALILRYPEELESLYRINPYDVVADALGTVALPYSVPVLADYAGHSYLTWSTLGANLYSPIVYLPASVGILLARTAGLSPLGLMYAARLANVFVFVAAIALVFRLAPDYRRMFAAVALLPMTLHQIGGVSADMMAIASSSIAVACLLWLRENPANRKALILIALVFATWVICKVNPWALAAVLLIPRGRFGSRRAWISYMGAVAGGMIVTVVVWQLLSYGNVEAFREQRAAIGFDLAARTAYITSHPIKFVHSAISFGVLHSPRYIAQYVGAFGWSMTWMRPALIQRVVLLLLLIVAATERARESFSLIERVIQLGVFLLGAAFLHAVLFVTDDFVGIQGRYFIPMSLFALLAVRQTKIALGNATLTAIVVLTAVVHGSAALAWIWARHYA